MNEKRLTSWIPGYEGIYEVDTDGRIFSWKSGKKVQIKTTMFKNSGHISVYLSSGDKRERLYVHRIVFSTFRREPLKRGEWIRHRDKDLANNSLSNLFKIDTRKEPVIDGREPRYKVIDEAGNEEVYFSKEEISKAYGITQRDVAKYIKMGGFVDVYFKKNLS